MCGIAGIFGAGWGEPRARAVLRRMIGAVRHRGPDAMGLHVGQGGGLAHARLSIIDLAAGRQPMGNEDETVWVSFNGEIFNYVELRAELETRGHVFRTHSDTEVIVHQYEEDGEKCVEKFNGDFAFAIWDQRRRRMMLARDRMGVRPLYYTQQRGVLVFGSEIKALLEYPGVRAELDPLGLDQCFTFWCAVAPRTAFRDIYELPAGHVLVASAEGARVQRYWELRYPERGEAQEMGGRSAEDIAEELGTLLLNATRIRLRADVPVGAYLSGGLDSSVVTLLIKTCVPEVLRTFSVGFANGEFDETAYQQEMVRALGTRHSAVMCRAEEIGATFEEVIWHTEKPVLRTAPAPLYQLARLVRGQGLKVVLTGEGADEILGGYDLFKEAKVRRFWARQPQSARRPQLLRQLYPYLAGLQGQPQAYLEAFFRSGLEHPENPFFSHMPRWKLTAQLKRLFSRELRTELGDYSALEELRAALPEAYGRWHWLSQAQYLETAVLLPGYILSSQGDRVSMAHAVEGRYPYLDPRVVELAATIPPRMKLKGLREKWILRQNVGRQLPESIVRRPKQPYRSPDAPSFFGGGARIVEALLSRRSIAQAGYFDPSAVERLVQKCRANPAVGMRDQMSLVGVLSVQLLDHQFFRPGVTAGADRELAEDSFEEITVDAQRAMKETVKAFVSQNLLYQDGRKSLDDEASFLEEGLIDSTGILHLVTFLEQRFSIRIADSEVVPDNLDSIARIARYVEGKQSAHQKVAAHAC